MEDKVEVSASDVTILTENKKNEILEELEKKIEEIDEKIKNKAESILAKDDIDFMEYQFLNSYKLDLKTKIDEINRKDSNENLIQLMSSMLHKNF